MGGDGIGKALAVGDEFAADEDVHMFAQPALVVEDVAAQAGMIGEDGVERLADGPGLHVGGRGGQEAFEVAGEADAGHSGPDRGDKLAEASLMGGFGQDKRRDGAAGPPIFAWETANP